MQPMTAGITKANTGLDGIVWNILGQTYVPKQLSEASFAWHATFPPGTFVPPHIHPTQDEFIYMLEGRMDATIDGKDFVATAGDVIKLPMGLPHGLFNKSDQVIKCFFWVTPTRKLYDLFWAIHSMKERTRPTWSRCRRSTRSCSCRRRNKRAGTPARISQPSCPDLVRAPTSLELAARKDVDARAKPAHDAGSGLRDLSQIV